MPKKTKYQKLLAQKHRQHQNPQPTYSYSPNQLHINRSITTDTTPGKSYEYVRRDLIKTVTLAMLFIVFELVLAFYSKKIGW